MEQFSLQYTKIADAKINKTNCGIPFKNVIFDYHEKKKRDIINNSMNIFIVF